jgi:hypothetical protein
MKVIKVVGGLGSQMMAYALYLSLKENRKEKIYMDLSSYSSYEQHNGCEIYDLFHLDKTDCKFFNVLNSRSIISKLARKIVFNRLTVSAQDSKYNYNPMVLTKSGFAIYEQCWTSWKYFSGIEEIVRNAFRFPTISDTQNSKVLNLINQTTSVSIHVRRGDYLSSPSLSNLAPCSYYEQAISYIEQHVENPVFFIFSDDVKWCKDNLNLTNAHFIDWNIGRESFKDIQLMSYCKHNIIPNSSFSWWGAYLNNNANKIVICPERWANSSSNVELADMNMDSWVVVRNFD